MDNQSMDNIDKLAKRLSSINKDFRKLAPHRILIIATLVLLLITAIFLIQRQQDIRGIFAGNEFTATFDGSPNSPLPITQRNQNDFDIQVHSRDRESWGDTEIPHMDAQHGPGCEGPEITHVVDNYEKAVFNCRGHLMTAINGEAGYGQIVLTPRYIADWKDGELVIKWDMSTFTMSTRDWVTVSVTPWEYNLSLLEGSIDETPDLAGPPKESIYISIGQNPFTMCVHDIRNHQNVNPVGWVDGNDCTHWDGIENYLTPSSSTRSPFEIRISPDRVTASLLNPDGTILKNWHDYKPSNHGLPPFTFNEGIVQFTQHSYTPKKDNSGMPATWHWDNIHISDATPFTMIKADKRHITQDGEVVTFNSPAPANSYLRFNATGNVDVSFDGGAYQRAQEPPQSIEPIASYFTPIPEGATKVAFKFSGRSWYDYEKQAKDFAIWSREVPVGGENPTSVPNPTATTTPNTPTATSAPQATATTAPTATQAPSATPTPVVNSISALSLSPVNSTNTVGNNFTVQVRVNTNGQTVNGVDAKLNFPTNLLSVISINDDGSAFDIEAESGVSNNTINLAYASSTPKSGNLLVATITFRANTAGTANVTFTSDSEVISNISNSNVLKTKTNGSYTLVNPTPTPTRIPTPTNTPVPTKAPLLTGDVNADGKVDVQDLSYILSKWRTSDAKADLNKNGRVDISDISILLENWTR